MDVSEVRKRWSALHDQWAEAHVDAQTARGLCTAKFRSGEGPSIAELDRADSLEARAEDLRGKMDEFTSTHLGE